jgi:anthranilate synthase component II
MILLIDNYDSFVFNLERYLRRLGQPTVVVRNDQVEYARIAAGEYAAIVISPGPKAPLQAGMSLQVVERFHAHVPMLGVCLGHQVICQAFGGRIVRAPRAVHGQSSFIDHHGSQLFAGLPSPFQAARYHSLVAEAVSLPEELRVIGTTASSHTASSTNESPIIMAVEHVRWPVFGVQFHPESILTLVGYRILSNFLQLAGLSVASDLPAADFASSSHACVDEPELIAPLAVLPQAAVRRP